MYQCSKCRKTFMERAAQCKCGAWNSHKEVDSTPGPQLVGGQENDETIAAPITSLDVIRDRRYSTGLVELDRVLGRRQQIRGLVYPSVCSSPVSLGSARARWSCRRPPTLSARTCGRVLYATGEESRSAVTARAERLAQSTTTYSWWPTTSSGRIVDQAKDVKPRFIILDSVQTMMVPGIEAEAGIGLRRSAPWATTCPRWRATSMRA